MTHRAGDERENPVQRVFLTGDTHGDVDAVLRRRRRLRDVPGYSDFLVVLGDFGFVFNGRHAETAALDRLARMHLTFLFLDGNHENFDRLAKYPEIVWNGGRVRQVRRNVLHLMRGHVFTISGRTFFVMGGAYSMDRPWRTEGRSWWPQELPDAAEYATARQSLADHGHKVDYILTHTAPAQTMALLRMDHPREAELGVFLDWVQEATEYEGWYFGHIHRDQPLWRRQRALYEDVVRL